MGTFVKKQEMRFKKNTKNPVTKYSKKRVNQLTQIFLKQKENFLKQTKILNVGSKALFEQK